MKSFNFLALIIFIVISQLAGFIGSLATTPSIPTWYASLNKPPFNPPNWLFAPVWLTLFLLMGFAAYLVWQTGWQKTKVKQALALFFVQLLFNVAWSFLFFYLKSPLFALIEIIILWLLILTTLISFTKINRFAGWLLVPYLLWVSFASILNFAIFKLNQ
jgi:benzodiazapine receptor